MPAAAPPRAPKFKRPQKIRREMAARTSTAVRAGKTVRVVAPRAPAADPDPVTSSDFVADATEAVYDVRPICHPRSKMCVEFALATKTLTVTCGRCGQQVTSVCVANS